MGLGWYRNETHSRASITLVLSLTDIWYCLTNEHSLATDCMSSTDTKCCCLGLSNYSGMGVWENGGMRA